MASRPRQFPCRYFRPSMHAPKNAWTHASTHAQRSAHTIRAQHTRQTWLSGMTNKQWHPGLVSSHADTSVRPCMHPRTHGLMLPPMHSAQHTRYALSSHGKHGSAGMTNKQWHPASSVPMQILPSVHAGTYAVPQKAATRPKVCRAAESQNSTNNSRSHVRKDSEILECLRCSRMHSTQTRRTSSAHTAPLAQRELLTNEFMPRQANGTSPPQSSVAHVHTSCPAHPAGHPRARVGWGR